METSATLRDRLLAQLIPEVRYEWARRWDDRRVYLLGYRAPDGTLIGPSMCDIEEWADGAIRAAMGSLENGAKR